MLDLPGARINVDTTDFARVDYPHILAQVRAAIKPPATLKKPESIAAWWASEADAAAQEAWRKQSLDGGT